MLTGRVSAHKRVQDMPGQAAPLPVAFTRRVICHPGPADLGRDEVATAQALAHAGAPFDATLHDMRARK